MILSIDWDWVTGDCADDPGHGCCGWCAPPPRKLSRGVVKKVKEGWLTRLEQLRKARPVDLGGGFWVAECHADILRIVRPDEEAHILHLDSHMDDADWFGLSCGSWRTFLPRGTTTESIGMEQLTKEHFHDVFICQSSPWTPASMDKFFWDLVHHLSEITGSDPEFIGHRRMALVRAWTQLERGREAETRAEV